MPIVGFDIRHKPDRRGAVAHYNMNDPQPERMDEMDKVTLEEERALWSDYSDADMAEIIKTQNLAADEAMLKGLSHAVTVIGALLEVGRRFPDTDQKDDWFEENNLNGCRGADGAASILFMELIKSDKFKWIQDTYDLYRGYKMPGS